MFHSTGVALTERQTRMQNSVLHNRLPLTERQMWFESSYSVEYCSGKDTDLKEQTQIYLQLFK